MSETKVGKMSETELIAREFELAAVEFRRVGEVLSNAMHEGKKITSTECCFFYAGRMEEIARQLREKMKCK